MILLDTNVLSELLRPRPDARVLAWIDAQDELDLWICAITSAEIRLGLALLPLGKRRAGLEAAAEALLTEDFEDRCLPFDDAASAIYAEIVSRRRRAGRPIAVEDAQIAAIARSQSFTIATRNTGDFEGIDGLTLIDPWTAG